MVCLFTHKSKRAGSLQFHGSPCYRNWSK